MEDVEISPIDRVEWGVNDELRQGDIFKWVEETNDPLKRYGIIITGDCDISQKKHWNKINFVPAVPLKEYINKFWYKMFLQKKAAEIEGNLCVEVRQFFTKSPSAPIKFLRELVANRSAEELANICKMEDSHKNKFLDKWRKKSEFVNFMEEYRLRRKSLSEESGIIEDVSEDIHIKKIIENI